MPPADAQDARPSTEPTPRQIELDRRGAAARITTTAAVVTCLGLLVFVLVVGVPQSVLALTCCSLAACGVFWVMARRGQHRAAAFGLVSAVTLSATLAVLFTRELGPSPFYLVLALLMAVAMLPPRQVVGTALIVCAALFLMSLASVGAPQPALSASTQLPNALAVILLSGVVAVLTAYSLERRTQEADGLFTELREAESRYRRLADSARDVILLLDDTGRVAYASPSVEHAHALTALAAVGRRLEDLFDLSAAEANADLGRARAGESVWRTVRHRHNDDSHGPRFSELALDRTPDGVGVLAAARDVTAREELSAQLREAQKLEALGRLAGGVAHDFNNLLAVVLAGLDLARIADREETRQSAQARAFEAAQRGVELTRQLLSFARRESLPRAEEDVGELATSFLPLLRALAGSRVAVSLTRDPVPLRVAINKPQLEQLLMNLVVNARDAIAGNGTVKLDVRADASGAQPMVVVEVDDDGPGVPLELREKVFEPFFTTKQADRGTGLGLSTCLSVVAQAGGTIDVQTNPLGGARFVVRLPACGAPPTSLREPISDAPVARLRTVLVLDDEPALLGLVERLLLPHAARVVSAEDAPSARSAARDAADLDAVVADATLADAIGTELLAELATENSRLALVLTSGYVFEPETLPVELRERVVFLAKPFQAAELTAALARAQRRSARSALNRP